MLLHRCKPEKEAGDVGVPELQTQPGIQFLIEMTIAPRFERWRKKKQRGCDESRVGGRGGR